MLTSGESKTHQIWSVFSKILSISQQGMRVLGGRGASYVLMNIHYDISSMLEYWTWGGDKEKAPGLPAGSIPSRLRRAVRKSSS